jgi:hypothetical protein
MARAKRQPEVNETNEANETASTEATETATRQPKGSTLSARIKTEFMKLVNELLAGEVAAETIAAAKAVFDLIPTGAVVGLAPDVQIANIDAKIAGIFGKPEQTKEDQAELRLLLNRKARLEKQLPKPNTDAQPA